MTQNLNKSEDEAKIRYQLGLSLKVTGDAEGARTQLESAAQILETARFEQKLPESRKSLFDLQTSCYHNLQQILVGMGKTEDALVAAERCKLRRLYCPPGSMPSRKHFVTCSEHIFDAVNRSKTSVLYYSIAGDELYAWFLQPHKRIIRFHSIKLDQSMLDVNGQDIAERPDDENLSLIEQYVNMVRECLGVNGDSVKIDDGWKSSSENLLDDINERAGFLRMVNRNHMMNSSNYSLSSLFSLGSVGGSVVSLQGSTRSMGSLQGSTRSRRHNLMPTWPGPRCLHLLYDILIAPFDDLLPTGEIGKLIYYILMGFMNLIDLKFLYFFLASKNGRKELIVVLESELYLVPFALLRSSHDDGEYLSERCAILTVPSIQILRQRQRSKQIDCSGELNTALVVGGPKIPSTLLDNWGWNDSSASLQEASMVADMLAAKTFLANNATKESVVNEIAAAECIHFSANVSWKNSGIVLSPGNLKLMIFTVDIDIILYLIRF